MANPKTVDSEDQVKSDKQNASLSSVDTTDRTYKNDAITTNKMTDDTIADPEITDVIDTTTPHNSIASMKQNNNNKVNINENYHENEIESDDDEPILYEQMSFCQLFTTIIGAAAGNFLEWFDFAVFGLLANELSSNFFPSGNETTRLLELFTVFAGAFLMRPLGGMLFGYLGDKFGRLFALRLSIFMMAFPTFLTGCLPTYDQIGITATLLLVFLRLLQVCVFGVNILAPKVFFLLFESMFDVHLKVRV